MGYPLRSNIFNAGSRAQRYFSRFPVQVAILFAPTDVPFVEYLKASFAELDRTTGEALAFFAVLDPPEAWLEDSVNRNWWRGYQIELGASPFTSDSGVLMREIARLFRISWREFPCLVASPNLWRAEYVTCPTSAQHLESQLNHLVKIVREVGEPNIGQIVSTLEAVTGVQVNYYPPNESINQRLRQFYDILNTLDPRQGLNRSDYRRGLAQQLDAAERNLEMLRRTVGISRTQSTEGAEDREQISRTQATGEADDVGQEGVDSVIEDSAGRLVAPASVAARVFYELHTSPDLPELLDEEAAVMIETALTVGSLLERLAEDSLRGLGPLNRRRLQAGRNPFRRQSRPQEAEVTDIDFTPGAQGAWKAFELEVNLSLVQAARAARQVPMPTYFALYDPDLPLGQGIVKSRQPGNKLKKVYINQQDWEDRDSGRHRFITLGKALYVVKAMLEAPHELLSQVIQRTLRGPLPETLLAEWEKIMQIRNDGSHVRRLSRQDYYTVIRIAIGRTNLEPLLRIKHALLDPEMGPAASSPGGVA